jgi:hypothetical protein
VHTQKSLNVVTMYSRPWSREMRNVLSSERAPYGNKTIPSFTGNRICSWMPDGARNQNGLPHLQFNATFAFILTFGPLTTMIGTQEISDIRPADPGDWNSGDLRHSARWPWWMELRRSPTFGPLTPMIGTQEISDIRSADHNDWNSRDLWLSARWPQWLRLRKSLIFGPLTLMIKTQKICHSSHWPWRWRRYLKNVGL